MMMMMIRGGCQNHLKTTYDDDAHSYTYTHITSHIQVLLALLVIQQNKQQVFDQKSNVCFLIALMIVLSCIYLQHA